MDLTDLSASELARIDTVCLDYESNLRAGDAPEIERFVTAYDGPHADLLRRELLLVRDEIENANSDSSLSLTSGSGNYFDPIELPSAGTQLGPYLVEEVLGRGGMGVVFKAFDKRLNRNVAIKVLSIEIAKRRDLTERFEREARAVAAISHPHIVELFDVGVADGLPYAVMELLDGELMDTQFQRGAMEPIEVRRIGAQVADALATAHQAGVIHRDLKPHNIMLLRRNRDEQPSVKLFDFGLSRVPSSILGDVEETGDGIVLGTPGYMAPEQTRGESVTASADVFSLGCVLFEAFYGRLAFDGSTKAKRFHATLNHDPVVDPALRRRDPALDDLIRQCLQKQAEKRPTAAEVTERLRMPIPRQDSTADQVARGRSAGKATRRRLFELLGGGIAGTAIGAFLYGRRGNNELTSIRSIAVLSFTDNKPAPVTPPVAKDDASPGEISGNAALTLLTPPPLGRTKMRRGEQLSAMLVHELTRLSEVTVPRFRPMTAETPREFRQIAEALEVDALVTGDVQTLTQGNKEFLEIDIQIISAKTGLELWGRKIQTESADNLLEQSKLATQVASVIGRRLTSTSEELAPPSVESFSCLVDGKTRSDPDSLQGLKMALMCFQDAHRVDPRFADPIAGIALTSITLAAQSESKKSIDLVRQARERSEDALQLDPSSIDARLAMAMLDWQTVGRFDQADRELQELVMVAPNNWQIRHQQGLLQLATGRISDAIRSLREASQLNPLSVVLKIDRARAQWFAGNIDRAIQDAIHLRDKYQNNAFARGLLVDIYEQRGQFQQAASQDDGLTLDNDSSSEEYYRLRADRLADLPYGPFGDVANAAILQTRTAPAVDDRALAQWIDPVHPPLLPLLLKVHPGFASIQSLQRAQEIMFRPSKPLTLGTRYVPTKV